LLTALAVALVFSLAANLLLYRQGREYYVQLNATRLDPLGLKAFPVEPTRVGPDQADPAKAKLAKAKPVVLFLGDSRAAAWPAPAQSDDFTFVNRGISAQTTAQVLRRYPYHVQGLEPDTVVLEVGINDLKAIPLFPGQRAAIVAECKANIQQIVALSTGQGARVILATIFPLGRIPPQRRPFWSDEVAPAIAEVNRYLATLASDDVQLFDAAAILSNRQGTVDPRYSHDFLHLNRAGYDALNRELARVLRP